MWTSEGVGRRIPQQCAPLQGASTQFERKRVSTPRQVHLAKLENSAWRSFNLRLRWTGRTGEPLYFESPAIGQRVTLGFLHENGDVLLWICSREILRFDGDAIEHAEVVQPPLRFNNVPFAKRLLNLNMHLSMDHSRPGVLVAAD